MRLSQLGQETMHAAVAEFFGADAVVHVFGSRVNDSARGGDIDLLVQSPEPVRIAAARLCSWSPGCKCASVTSPSTLITSPVVLHCVIV
jgi:hypothetical protein